MITKNQVKDLFLKLNHYQHPQEYILQSGKRLEQEEYLEVIIDFLTNIWVEIPKPKEKIPRPSSSQQTG